MPIRGDEVGYIDRETMEWVRSDAATIEHMRNIVLGLRARANNAEVRVKELESERDAMSMCYLCKVNLEPVGTPESRVPRCDTCPEPESMDEVGSR